MTRWARGGSGNQKKELEGTSWKDMKKDSSLNAKSNSHLHEKEKGDARNDTFDKDMEKFSEDMKTFKHDFSNFNKHKHHFQKSKPEFAGVQKPGSSKYGLPSKRSHKHTPTKKKGLSDMINKLRDDFSEEMGAEEEKEVAELLKKQERSEERRIKRIHQRQDSKMCYKCRQTGHNMSECTASTKETATGICFKCGSTEHSMFKCPVRLPPGKYPYASCFICKETGHLSKQCPDNPRGLYPNGGCCKTCGSVEHFNRDCPEAQEKQGIQNISLAVYDGLSSVDEEVSIGKSSKKPIKKVPKVVKF